MNCSYQCDFATDHLGIRIASRDALAPTKDISCLSIWWRDWFRSDPIAVRYLVRISKVWYKYHGVFSLRISNSIPTPLLQLPTICRVLIVLLLLRSQSSSGDEQLAPSTLSCKDSIFKILEDIETDQESYIKIQYNISNELFIIKMFMTAFNKVIILEFHDHHHNV